MTHEQRVEVLRDKALRRRYGISLAEFDLLNTGRCWACDTDEAGGRDGTFHVDHDHDTGELRAILCSNCNAGLGKLGDSIEALQQMIKVLQQGPAVVAAKLAEHREHTPFVPVPKQAKYNWDQILDGAERTFVPSIDFDCTAMSFCQGARTRAKATGQIIRIRTNEDGSIRLRATNQPVVGSVDPTTTEEER